MPLSEIQQAYCKGYDFGFANPAMKKNIAARHCPPYADPKARREFLRAFSLGKNAAG